MTERRLQVVEVTDENVGELFRGNMAVVEGLPEDAELVKTWEEPARQTYCFAFKSEEFPVVEEGREMPSNDIAIVQRRVNNRDYWVCPNCFDTMENGDVR